MIGPEPLDSSIGWTQGMYLFGTATTLTNSTVSGNTATGDGSLGGGIFMSQNGAASSFDSVTISGNSAPEGGGFYLGLGSLSLNNSIVANNSAATGPDCSTFGTATAATANIVEDTTGCTIGGTAPTTGDPTLGALANNEEPPRRMRS